jgi:RNA polymerase primary sigma factor
MNEFSSYLRDIKELPDFREDSISVSDMVRMMRKGDENAVQALIESSLKYIAELVAKHCYRWGAWQNQMELVQEANFEVVKKIAEYDPAKAPLERFIYYRAYFAFVRFWSTARPVHVTDYGRKIFKYLQRSRDQLTKELGREPSLEELSNYTGRDESEIQGVQTSPTIRVVGIGGNEEDEKGNSVVSLDSLPSVEFDVFRSIEASEIEKILIECLGERDTDLLLTYIESGAEDFRLQYSKSYHKEITTAAARKIKQRMMEKVKNCLQKRFEVGEKL